MKVVIPEHWHSNTQAQQLDQETTSLVGYVTVQMELKE
jgi:hypothetical protein